MSVCNHFISFIKFAASPYSLISFLRSTFRFFLCFLPGNSPYPLPIEGVPSTEDHFFCIFRYCDILGSIQSSGFPFPSTPLYLRLFRDYQYAENYLNTTLLIPLLLPVLANQLPLARSVLIRPGYFTSQVPNIFEGHPQIRHLGRRLMGDENAAPT